MSKPSLNDYALLISLSAMFGASFLLIKISIVEIPTLTLVAARLLIAAVILWVTMKMAGQQFPRGTKIWIWIIVAAIFGNVLPWWLITWGQVKVDAGLTAILMATMPLATLLLAHVFTVDEKLNIWKILGVMFGIAGVVVLIGYDQLTTLGEDTIRQYAIALAAICYGVNAIITKQLIGHPRRAMAASLMIVSLIMVTPFAILVDQPWTIAPSIGVVIAVLLLGIFPSALGTLMIFAIVARQGASFLSQINFLVPVFGVLWSYLFLSEQLSLNAFFALILILVGVALARINPNILKRKTPKEPLEERA